MENLIFCAVFEISCSDKILKSDLENTERKSLIQKKKKKNCSKI